MQTGSECLTSNVGSCMMILLSQSYTHGNGPAPDPRLITAMIF